MGDNRGFDPPIREGLCQICKVEYPVWFAPNELWNKVMRLSDGSEPQQFVCPTCFAIKAEKAGIVPTAWTLAPESNDVFEIGNEPSLESLKSRKPTSIKVVFLPEIFRPIGPGDDVVVSSEKVLAWRDRSVKDARKTDLQDLAAYNKYDRDSRYSEVPFYVVPAEVIDDALARLREGKS